MSEMVKVFIKTEQGDFHQVHVSLSKPSEELKTQLIQELPCLKDVGVGQISLRVQDISLDNRQLKEFGLAEESVIDLTVTAKPLLACLVVIKDSIC